MLDTVNAGADRISDTRAAVRMGRDGLSYTMCCLDNYSQLVKIVLRLVGRASGVMPPPVAITLITSTPRSARSTTAARNSAGSSASPPRNQQWPPVRVTGGPEANISGAVAPVAAYSSRTASAR